MSSIDLTGGNIEPRGLEEEMRSSYLDYVMSVIVGTRDVGDVVHEPGRGELSIIWMLEAQQVTTLQTVRQHVEAGLVESGAWTARAITLPDDPGSRGQAPAPLLRREFDVPSPIAPPAACVFHPRCPRFHRGHCDVEEPLLREVGTQEVACHYPLERWPMTAEEMRRPGRRRPAEESEPVSAT